MKIFIVIIVFVASALLSCQKSKEVTQNKAVKLLNDRLKSISLSDTLNMYTGTTRQLPILLTPSDYPFDSLKFKSTDTTVITISASGLMSAKKVGSATISVSNLIDDVTASTLITVSTAPHKDRLKSIALSDTLNMYAGKTRQLPITLTPSNYHFDSLKFVSSDTTVLTISSAGLISAKKAGESTISINNLTNTVSANTVVTVFSVPVIAKGLIAYYPFNNSAADMSGNGYNGAANNVTATTDRFGNANGAYYFKNIGADSSWVTIQDNPALRLNGTDFTINAWIKISTYNGNTGAIIIDKRGHITPECWALGVSGQRQFYNNIPGVGIPYFTTSDQNLSNPVLAGGKSIDTVNWHMITIVFTVSNKSANLYIDGVLTSSVINMPIPGVNNNADIYIGKDNPLNAGGFNFQGKINDIRIYNIAISTQQITGLYNAPN